MGTIAKQRPCWQTHNWCYRNFLWKLFALNTKKHDKRKPCLFRKKLTCLEMLFLCSKTFCCYDTVSNKLISNNKGFHKQTLKPSGVGPRQKYRRVLDDAKKNESTGIFSQGITPLQRMSILNETYRISIETWLGTMIKFTQAQRFCKFNFLWIIFCVEFLVLKQSN